MKILLTGATGFIGNEVLRALNQQNHFIIACSRNSEDLLIKSANIKPLAVDFISANRVEAWLPYLDGVDVVINCVGIIAENRRQTFTQVHELTPIALFKAAAQAGVKKIIQLSALGADAEAASAYHLSKRAADDALRQLPLAWYVLQPSIVYGDRAQSMALFQALAALPVHVLPDGGGQLLQPIHVDDVVAAILRCVDDSAPVRQTLALVGPSPIAYAHLLHRLRLRLCKPAAKTLALPLRLVAIAAGFGPWLGEPILSKDNIMMLSRGNTADAAQITELLGRPPRSLAECLFAKPASNAERLHALLYFLKPVLRLVIAFVWLWSGITSLFFYPHELSYQLLAATGIVGISAPVALYGLAIMDIALGLATLTTIHTRRLIGAQLWVVLIYTAVVGFALPEFWLHPFGPLIKNIPFLLTLWIYLILLGETS